MEDQSGQQQAAEPYQRKTAFIFLAAGGQKHGMWNHLKELGKNPVENALQSLEEEEAATLERVCTEGPEDQLHLANMTNPAIFCQSWATYELLAENGIRPHAVVGYSLGEYAALAAAGVCTFKAGLTFLNFTSEKYQNAFPGGKYFMTSVRNADPNLVREACLQATREGKPVYISNFHGPKSLIICGEREGIDLAWSQISCQHAETEKKVMRKDIPVYVPSHTPLVKDMEKNLFPFAQVLFENHPDHGLKLISTVNANYVSDLNQVRRNMERHLSSPVLWQDTVELMLQEGYNTFVELGPTYGLVNGVVNAAKAHDIHTVGYHTSDRKGFDALLKGFGKE